MTQVAVRRSVPWLGLVLCVGALATAPLAGCERSDEGPADPSASGLVHAARPVPPDVAGAAREPDALVRAVKRPWRDGARGLGAHTFLGTHLIELREGDQVIERIDEKTTLLAADDGALALRYANDRGYGRELFFRPPTADAAAVIWVRPGFGKFHRRPPAEDDEPWRVADETFATLAADLELYAPGLAIADGGAVTHLGRPARKVTLSLGAPRPAADQPRPERAWRRTVVVSALAGEVLLDEATGALLEGKLTATGSFERDGKKLTMTVTGTHAVADLGARVAPTFPADADAIDTPRRTTEFVERTELLDGLAPPPRRAPSKGELAPARTPRRP